MLASPTLQCLKLKGNLVGSYQVIGTQPLNTITTAVRKSIPRSGVTAVLLGDDAHPISLELSRYGQSTIRGAIVDHKYLFGLHVWASAERIVSAIHSCALKAEMRIETKGIAIVPSYIEAIIRSVS